MEKKNWCDICKDDYTDDPDASECQGCGDFHCPCEFSLAHQHTGIDYDLGLCLYCAENYEPEYACFDCEDQGCDICRGVRAGIDYPG
jgi:hypothetical protein